MVEGNLRILYDAVLQHWWRVCWVGSLFQTPEIVLHSSVQGSKTLVSLAIVLPLGVRLGISAIIHADQQSSWLAEVPRAQRHRWGDQDPWLLVKHERIRCMCVVRMPMRRIPWM